MQPLAGREKNYGTRFGKDFKLNKFFIILWKGKWAEVASGTRTNAGRLSTIEEWSSISSLNWDL
jgi:hypothetical protein